MKPEGMDVDTPITDEVANSGLGTDAWSRLRALCGHFERESAAKDQELARMREDTKRLDWLDSQVVKTIHYRNWSFMDVAGTPIRDAIDAALSEPMNEHVSPQKGEGSIPQEGKG